MRFIGGHIYRQTNRHHRINHPNTWTMTPEQLLQPRYLVIADYPNSIYKVGKLLIEDRDFLFYEGMNHKNFIKPYDFPHIFRRLEWWECRDIKDMPEYVKGKDGSIYKISEDRKSVV